MAIVEKSVGPRAAIEQDPLPQAGESLRAEIDRIQEDRIGFWLVYFSFAVAYPVVEWWRYFFRQPVSLGSSILISVVGMLTSTFCIWRLVRLRRITLRLAMGARGEQHVGNYLNDMCGRLGYRILHDIPGNDFNVDHALIGPGGIFSIETKTWTKPAEAAVLVYDGESVTKPGGAADSGPVAQAKRNADFIRKLVAKRIGRAPGTIWVRPVVLFPGWFIDGKSFGREVWVLGNDTLHQILPTEHRRLSPEDVAWFFDSLSEYSRNFRK